jgi:hypothetical protein
MVALAAPIAHRTNFLILIPQRTMQQHARDADDRVFRWDDQWDDRSLATLRTLGCGLKYAMVEAEVVPPRPVLPVETLSVARQSPAELVHALAR